MVKIEVSPKGALDSIIKKSRVHLYKPIQIAEILKGEKKKTVTNVDAKEASVTVKSEMKSAPKKATSVKKTVKKA